MIKRIKKTLTNLTGKVGRKIIRRPKKVETEVVKKSPTPKNEVKSNKVLMFGWELPPFNSGGLGVACFELAQSLSGKNSSVTFVLPGKVAVNPSFMKVAFAEKNQDANDSDSRGSSNNSSKNFKVKTVDAVLSPYLDAASYEAQFISSSVSGIATSKEVASATNNIYGHDLISEVYRYGEAAKKIARKEDFSVIHAHDWLSYPAGIAAKKVSKKPLIAHVHAIEYDRSHEHGVNQQICAIEKQGLEAADKIIAVSDYTRRRIHTHYGIPLEKIAVVHNGISFSKKPVDKLSLKSIKAGGKKMVLFVGRITYQKGVDYLIEAARKALRINPNIIFMIVGSGDMMYQIIEQAAYFGISDKVFFPGFMRGQDLENIYAAADLYVMPSVSEPFGLVALEALSAHVPVIVSNQSGAAEVLKHSLKVDFWDTDGLANKIVSVINHPALQKSLATAGYNEVLGCTWDKAADKCIDIYNELSVAQ